MKKSIFSMLAVTVLFTGCEKDNSKPDIPKNVYVAGVKWTSDWFNKSDAVLWNNAKSTLLDENGMGKSVFVSGNDVYVAGQVYGYNFSIATLWKNGKAQNLFEGNCFPSANSVFVTGNDVYVAGEKEGAPTLWKNGIAQKLADSGYAYSVYVANGYVYVAIFTSSGSKLWTNGIEQNIESIDARSVFVSNDNDVYIAGEDKSQGYSVVTLWKNGEIQHLTNQKTYGFGYSVFVSGNDVYVAGSERNEGAGSGYRHIAKVWKNGIPQNLTDGTEDAYAKSVFVSDNDVYVVGKQEGVAKLWINGKVHKLNERTKVL
jgi:hypothetical protein